MLVNWGSALLAEQNLPLWFVSPLADSSVSGKTQKLIINREAGREKQSSKLSAKRKRSQLSLP